MFGFQGWQTLERTPFTRGEFAVSVFIEKLWIHINYAFKSRFLLFFRLIRTFLWRCTRRRTPKTTNFFYMPFLNNFLLFWAVILRGWTNQNILRTQKLSCTLSDIFFLGFSTFIRIVECWARNLHQIQRCCVLSLIKIRRCLGEIPAIDHGSSAFGLQSHQLLCFRPFLLISPDNQAWWLSLGFYILNIFLYIKVSIQGFYWCSLLYLSLKLFLKFYFPLLINNDFFRNKLLIFDRDIWPL